MSEQTADIILLDLKMRGPQTAKALSKRLGMTAEGARQHLAKLLARGLVDHRDAAEAVGRPKRYWRLSDHGHQRFPDGHPQLMLDVIKTVREEFGDAGLERVIAARETQMLQSYGDALGAHDDLGGKVAALAALRNAEGYMAESRPDGEDSYLLIENHCPICTAAAACQGFCRSEIETFRRSLGSDVCVERCEHLLSGARRCVYRISTA